MTTPGTGKGASIIAAIVMIDALVLLNGAYLWDLIVGKYDGWIQLGWKAYIAIAIANIAIVASMAWLLVRAARAGRGDDSGPPKSVGR